MIQRKQSIFIAIAAILCIIMFFLPLAAFIGYDKDLIYYAFDVFNPKTGAYFQHNYIIFILLCITLLFTLTALFLYKKRPLQMKITNLALLLNSILVVAAFLLIDHTAKAIFGHSDNALISYKYTFVFPLINMILLFLAARAIKKDEAMVRAADRLR